MLKKMSYKQHLASHTQPKAQRSGLEMVFSSILSLETAT